MGLAAAPLHPLRVVPDGLGFGDAGALEEHDQVVVAVGGAEYLVPAAAAHGDSPAARLGGSVHDDRCAGHATQHALDQYERRLAALQAFRGPSA